MNKMYQGCSKDTTTAAAPIFTDKELKKIAKDYFDGKLKKGEIHPDIWAKVVERLKEGLDTGFGKLDPKDDDLKDLHEALTNNVAVFAAFKNHQQAKELHSLLLDEEGKQRSFANFLKEAKKVDETYNQLWLESEFNYATRAARSAKQWKEFERTQDLYPNLEYMASRAGTPRESHKDFYGIVLPVSDPFWESMLPPNGWGCKCSVRKSRGDVTEGNFEPVDQIPGIPGNAGKAKQLFDSKHPYVQNTTKTDKKSVQKQLKGLQESIFKGEVKTKEDLQDVMNNWLNQDNSRIKPKVIKLDFERKRSNNGSTDRCGNIWLSKSRMELCAGGFENIRKGKKTTFEQEDAISTLWHEVVHNKNNVQFRNITSLQRMTMELGNEYVARKTVDVFIQELGGEMQNKELRTNRFSTGYNTMVNNFDVLVKAAKCDESKVLEGVSKVNSEIPYSNQATGIQQVLYENQKTKMNKTEMNKHLRATQQYSEDGFKKYMKDNGLLIEE